MYIHYYTASFEASLQHVHNHAKPVLESFTAIGASPLLCTMYLHLLQTLCITCSVQVEVYRLRLELGLHPLTEGRTVTRNFSRVDKMCECKGANEHEH